MSLPSLQLDAFLAVAHAQSFTQAAKALHITQSALSQRVLNLEQELGSTLFIRDTAGIRLTEWGQKLLRYCQMKESMETELLMEFGQQTPKTLGGLVKVGGFSTVVRSLLIPHLAPILKNHPDVQVEFLTRELRDLPLLLESGRADFILLNKPLEKQGIVNIELGHEEYVLVEPSGIEFRKEVYLDHDPEDTTTMDFFKAQVKAPVRWKRSYFDDIYSIIDGVLLGAGRAVVPRHLAKTTKGLRVVKGYRPLHSQVFLCYYQQNYYSSLQQKVTDQILKSIPKLLNQK